MLHRLTGWALEQHVDLTGLEVIRPTLEDVYLELTGSPAGRRDRPGRAGRPDGRTPVVNDAALTLSQVRYTNKAFWRNPASAFFIFAFPLMFLVIFTALLGHGTVRISPNRLVNTATYYVAAMASFGVISACYTNIAISVTTQRDAGVLKRTNGTPLPSAVYLGARMLHSLLVAVLLVVITAAFGRLLYSASVPVGLTLLRFLVMLLVGAAASARSASRSPRSSPTPTPRRPSSTRRSCRCCSCPASSSRWAATRPPGSSGSPGSSRSGTSPGACRPGSSAPRSAGPTCWSWRPGAWAACCWPSGSSAGSRVPERVCGRVSWTAAEGWVTRAARRER